MDQIAISIVVIASPDGEPREHATDEMDRRKFFAVCCLCRLRLLRLSLTFL